MKAKTFKKITVNGSIQLGLQHELIQGPRARTGIESMFATRGSGPAYLQDARRMGEDDTLGELLEFRFSHKPQRELRTSNKGLVTSYGIFGAPGCGKTVLLKHLLEQLLAHSPDDPVNR